MGKTPEKTKTKVILKQDSATEFDVTLIQDGVKVSFCAVCEDPKKDGTGNQWKVTVYDVVTEKGSEDVKAFMESHELLDNLRSDLQDWSFENLEIDLENIEHLQEAYHRESMDRLSDSYTW